MQNRVSNQVLFIQNLEYAEHCIFISTEAEEAHVIQVTREPGILHLHLHTATVNNLVLFTQN